MTDEDYFKVYRVKPCLEGLSREETTDELSRMLESLVLYRRNAWACWAAEVKLPPDEKRVDYVDYCPHPSISCCSVGAVERGKFTFYEVKSCIADLKSGHGTNFVGDINWLVCPIEMYEEMRQKQIHVSGCGVLAFGTRKNGSRGFVKLLEFSAGGDYSYRKHSAAELLYAMTRAGIRQGRTQGELQLRGDGE